MLLISRGRERGSEGAAAVLIIDSIVMIHSHMSLSARGGGGGGGGGGPYQPAPPPQPTMPLAASVHTAAAAAHTTLALPCLASHRVKFSLRLSVSLYRRAEPRSKSSCFACLSLSRRSLGIL
jgi:hypothetical protein